MYLAPKIWHGSAKVYARWHQDTEPGKDVRSRCDCARRSVEAFVVLNTIKCRFATTCPPGSQTMPAALTQAMRGGATVSRIACDQIAEAAKSVVTGPMAKQPVTA
mmetsp:Transcript_123865/g.241218  ORF Transcript_123865/g.241218 Transcript_123865/m.241218 type:complete len:105 (+) Transcript_123865:859-1173(+)